MSLRVVAVGGLVVAVIAACAPSDRETASSVAATVATRTVDVTTAAVSPGTSVSSQSSIPTDRTAPATTVEPSADVSLDPGDDLPLGGPTPVGAPLAVVVRAPLPYCGATAFPFPPSGDPYPEIEIVANASECYRVRAESGLPTELILIGPTTEGDPILAIRRLLPDGREETFRDSTRDRFGTKAWFRVICDGYLPPGSQEENCRPTEQIAWAEVAPPETALVELAFQGHGPGPPFFLTSGIPASVDGPGDGWATHDLTITSEWRTPIAVAAGNLTQVIDLIHDLPEPRAEVGEPTILQPGEATTVQLAYEVSSPGGLRPGRYEIRIPISYWRNVDTSAPPTGPADDTLILVITYEFPDVWEAAGIATFCQGGVAGAALLDDFEQERLTQGLNAIEAAAGELPDALRIELLAEIDTLRAAMAVWFDPEPSHSGFSTSGVVGIINQLCHTERLALTVIA